VGTHARTHACTHARTHACPSAWARANHRAGSAFSDGGEAAIIGAEGARGNGFSSAREKGNVRLMARRDSWSVGATRGGKDLAGYSRREEILFFKRYRYRDN